MKKKCILFIIIISFLFSGYGQWIQEKALNNVILIEKKDSNYFIPHGTGFLLWNYTDSNYPILITCAHLVSRDELYISLNADSSFLSYIKNNQIEPLQIDSSKWYIIGKKLRCKINFKSYPFLINKDLDICAFPIKLPNLELQNNAGETLCTISKPLYCPKSMIKSRNEIKLGDEVYFIGFPLGLGTLNKNEPLIRSGSIAWISEGNNEFLLDAFSYGGNSGSPVYMKTILGSKPGEIKWSEPKLVGMITGHLRLFIENILTQPNENELKFEINDVDLNFGLARVVYTDYIIEIADKAEKLVYLIKK